MFWTEFKQGDVRRETKQEIPDLTRVHPGDRKVVSPPRSRKLPGILQGTASAHRQLPLTPRGKWLMMPVLEEKEGCPSRYFYSTKYNKTRRTPTDCQAARKHRLLSTAHIHSSLPPLPHLLHPASLSHCNPKGAISAGHAFLEVIDL